MIDENMTADSNCETTVLARNLMVDLETLWTIQVIVSCASLWATNQRPPHLHVDGKSGRNCIEQLLLSFDDKFSRIHDSACEVRHSRHSEPQESGMYAVWPDVPTELPQPGAAAELRLLAGNSDRNVGPNEYAWQELPEGPVLKRQLEGLIELCPQFVGLKWISPTENLAISLMFDQEMIKALQLLEAYAFRWCIDATPPDLDEAESIYALIHGFKVKFKAAMDCAVRVMSGRTSAPASPGKYVVWTEDRLAGPGNYSPRSSAYWDRDNGWSVSGVELWMPPLVYPEQIKGLAQVQAECPKADFKSEQGTWEWYQIKPNEKYDDEVPC